MRRYATDSPEAVARVVALALLADGTIDPGRIEAFKRSGYCFRLGMDRSRFEQVIDEFCDDMQTCGDRNERGQYELDSQSIGKLLADIDDRVLRAEALALMRQIIGADGVVVAGESALIAQVIACWQPGCHAAPIAARSQPNWQASYRHDNAFC